MHRLRNLTVVTVAAAVLALSALTLAQQGAPASPAPQASAVPASFTEVARKGPLRLLWDGGALQFAVEDARTGARWHSSPPNAAQEKEIQPQWLENLASLFLVSYTDERFQQTTLSSMAAEVAPDRGKATASIQDETILIRFDLKALELQFDLAIRLLDGGLDVRIPGESVKEGKKARLTQIDLLPFFGAARSDVEGYLVIPDGSGALVRFREQRSPLDQHYSEPVYGLDPALKAVPSTRQPVLLPIFGTALRPGHPQTGAALLGAVTEGEEAARINAATSAYAVPYYRAWPSFHFRQIFSAALSASRTVDRYEAALLGGDRGVRYTFLSGTDATYAGMAGAYRSYLTGERKVPRLRPGQGPLASLRLTGGDEERDALMEPYIVATTFDQGRRIVEALLAERADKLNVIYDYWMEDGRPLESPSGLEPEGRLGGGRGLTELGEFLRSRQIPFYLAHNVALMESSGWSLTGRDAMVRGTDRQPVTWGRQGRTVLVYSLNPQVVLERYLKSDLPRFKGYGTGLLLNPVYSLTSDQTSDRVQPRREAAAHLTAQARTVREQLGRAASETLLPFMLGHLDFVQALPTQGSYLRMADETVPLLQIAVHGLVAYGSDFGNLRAEPKREFLKAVETGAIPSYRLTYSSSDALQQTGAGLRLQSSHYKEWLPALLEEYRRYERGLAHTRGQFITGHRLINADLAETTYEDGTRVVVNYGGRPASVGGVTVPAMDFAVIRGR